MGNELRLFQNSLRLLLLLLIGGLAAPVLALDPPTGKVVLKILGNVAKPNVGAEAHFDFEMLEALPQHSNTFSAPWFAEEQTFNGPLLSDVFEAAGVTGTEMRVVALNEYAADMPVEDTLSHGAILAIHRNGKRMRIRDRGPTYITFPFERDERVRTAIFMNRSVWSIDRIEVK